MSEALPPARRVEAEAAEIDGQQVVAVADPLGLMPQPVGLHPVAFLVLAHLDGQVGPVEISDLIGRRTGQVISEAEVVDLVKRLDDLLLLDTDRFRRARSEAVDQMLALGVRPAVHAGLSYPQRADQLKAELDRMLALAPPEPRPGLTGLIAPHIDFQRGEAVYARAYQALDPTVIPPDRLIVLLGTAHNPADGLFAPCPLDFETPLGRARTDRDLAERLMEAAGPQARTDLITHRGEHSLEFQVVWLQHLLGPEINILPVLCGGLASAREGGPSPARAGQGREFTAALADLVARREALVVMGADLAHVGPQFGHEGRLQEADTAAVEAADREMLGLIAAGRAEEFYGFVADELDSRNICGLAPIYAGLEALGQPAGQELGYDYWLAEDGSGLVSFAAAAF